MRIHELKYSNTNTYLIEGEKGKLIFDTGWAGTFPAFCRALGQIDVPLQSIDYILISHYHPDHMGIAQEIAKKGPVLVVPDVQADYLHAADNVFAKEEQGNTGSRSTFVPIDDSKVYKITLKESGDVLNKIGIYGRILHTPGHSDDSISLYLDSGELFVGDLNPLYELALHKGTQTEESWKMLLALKPKIIYYGHAKSATMPDATATEGLDAVAAVHSTALPDLYDLTSRIITLIDKGCDVNKICKKTGADERFIQDVMRMYLTHQGISIRGILDRIEIKGR
ncbi:MAG: MBL fold metallo-hydrolase [Lachnospiraceae bacterium]|nr:MBL fold metallo-hydrolase [Lachnospiraceae bacterium]